MANGHGGRRAGAGRRPGPEKEWDEMEVITDKYFWVEGRVIIYNWNEEARTKRDIVWPILREMGLTPQMASAKDHPDDDGTRVIRREWSHRRVAHEEVLDVIKDHPGKTARFLAKEVYHDPRRHAGEPWTDDDQRHAESKIHAVVHRLKRKILKRYNEDGKLVYFPLGHPEADHYALTPSGRIMPTTTAVRPNDLIIETPVDPNDPDGKKHYTVVPNGKLLKWPTKANPEG